MEFNDSLEARKIASKLSDSIYQINYNQDLRKMLANINKMIDELASLEVEARRTKRSSITDSKRKEIAKAVDHLDKLIMIMRLTG